MKGRVLMVSIETLGKLARQTTIAAPRSCRALSFLTRCTRIVERKRIFCNAERERIPRLKRRGRRGGGIECRKSENISKRGGKRGKRGRKGLKRGKIVDKSFSFQIIKSSWHRCSDDPSSQLAAMSPHRRVASTTILSSLSSLKSCLSIIAKNGLANESPLASRLPHNFHGLW